MKVPLPAAVVAVLIAVSCLLAQGAPCSAAAAGVARDDAALTVTALDGTVQAYTLAQVQALTQFAGFAGYLDTISRVSGPHQIKGVSLADVLARAGYDYTTYVSVLASDGYSATLSPKRVQGRGVTTYTAAKPYTKVAMPAGNPLIPVLAYEEDGAAVAAGDGPLRLWYGYRLGAEPGYLVDSGLCVRGVDRVTVTGTVCWTLALSSSKKTVRLDRDDFAALDSRYGRTVRVAGHTYRGVPLFRLVGRVDGGGSSFRTALARAGYTIKLSSPSRTVKLSSKTIADKPGDILVAWKLDGRELTAADAPLCLTGAVKKAKRISGIERIALAGARTRRVD